MSPQFKTQAELQPRFEMPATKLTAFHEEFPWIRAYVSEPICQAYVSRITKEVVERALGYKVEGDFWSEGDLHSESAFLLDEQGQLVEAEKTITLCLRRYWFFGQKIERPKVVKVGGHLSSGQTIEKALTDLGDEAVRVRFVLSYWSWTGGVIVYKPPANMTILEYVRRQIEAERTQIREQVEQISVA